MIFEGVVRRFVGLKNGKAPIDIRITHQESVAVAQVEPPGFEMTRAGRRFHLGYNGTAPTGIAPVQAFPTTAAQWVLWNPDLAKTYHVESVGAIVLSGTTGLGGQILAAVFQSPAQTGAQVAGLGVMSASNSNTTSRAIIKASVTITTPAVPVWAPVAEQVGAAAVVGPASCIMNRATGKTLLAIPPGFGLGLAILAPAGVTPLYLPIVEWIEQEADME